MMILLSRNSNKNLRRLPIHLSQGINYLLVSIFIRKSYANRNGGNKGYKTLDIGFVTLKVIDAKGYCHRGIGLY